MAQMIIPIVHRGAPDTVKVAPIDIVRFERQHGVGVSALAEGRLDHLCWIAWHVLQRTKRTSESYDAWLDGLDEIGANDEEVAVPLDQAASPG